MKEYISINSEIDPSADIYFQARVSNSFVKKNAVVGNFSRVDFSRIDEYVRIDRNNHIYHVSAGRHSYTGMNSVIMHATVGAFCSIAWNVSIGGAHHDYSRIAQHAFLYNKYDKLRPQDADIPYDRFSEPVVIGNDVWIGCGAVICRGITIGDGAVIGANAVVTHDVQPYTVVAGSPARLIKHRFFEEITELLLKLKWWDWEDDKIFANFSALSSQPSIEMLNKLLDEMQKNEKM